MGGAVRELFLDMNARALRAQDPGEQAEIPPAWPRLGEIAHVRHLEGDSATLHEIAEFVDALA